MCQQLQQRFQRICNELNLQLDISDRAGHSKFQLADRFTLLVETTILNRIAWHTTKQIIRKIISFWCWSEAYRPQLSFLNVWRHAECMESVPRQGFGLFEQTICVWTAGRLNRRIYGQGFALESGVLRRSLSLVCLDAAQRLGRTVLLMHLSKCLINSCKRLKTQVNCCTSNLWTLYACTFSC